MWTIKKILVATDFTPASQPAVDAAVVLAAKFDAALVLMHAYHIPLSPAPTYNSLAQLTTFVEGCARKELRELAGTYGDRGVRIDTCLYVGSPWEQILRAAKEHGADLIVVGSRGLRGLPRALLGSTAERVVRYAPVPVLTQHWRDAQPAKSSAVATAAKAADQLVEQWLI
jgi:nucleotide-binding universal stress UspA family protein